MKNEMAINTYLSTTESMKETKQQEEQRQIVGMASVLMVAR